MFFREKKSESSKFHELLTLFKNSILLKKYIYIFYLRIKDIKVDTNLLFLRNLNYFSQYTMQSILCSDHCTENYGIRILLLISFHFFIRCQYMIMITNIFGFNPGHSLRLPIVMNSLVLSMKKVYKLSKRDHRIA